MRPHPGSCEGGGARRFPVRAFLLWLPYWFSNPRCCAPPLTSGLLGLLLRLLLGLLRRRLLDLALAQDRHHLRNFLARLFQLTRIFQLLRDRLAAQVEQVLALLDQLVLQVIGLFLANLFEAHDSLPFTAIRRPRAAAARTGTGPASCGRCAPGISWRSTRPRPSPRTSRC